MPDARRLQRQGPCTTLATMASGKRPRAQQPALWVPAPVLASAIDKAAGDVLHWNRTPHADRQEEGRHRRGVRRDALLSCF